MNNFLDILMQQFGGQTIDAVSQKFGINNDQTKIALSQFLPIITRALAGNSQSRGGADALHNAISKDHDGSILDNLMDAIAQPDEKDGAGILGHVLGGQSGAVADFIGRSAGLDASTIGAIMKMAAPIVLGSLGKQQRTNGFDAGGLSDFLQQTNRDVQRTDPKNMGMIGRLLDQDNDGNVWDDVASMGMGFLQNWMNGRSRGL